MVAGPMPWSSAVVMHTLTFWCFNIMLAVFFTLSIVRVFIVVKVTVDYDASLIKHGVNFQPIEFNDMNHEMIFRTVLATLVSVATIVSMLATIYCYSTSQGM
jgi:hypothetical protein